MAPAYLATVPALRRVARWAPVALFSSGIVAGDRPVLVSVDAFPGTPQRSPCRGLLL
jgi:hypothetical protein